jgi:hypothetical protein
MTQLLSFRLRRSPLVASTEVLDLIREKEVRAVDLRFMDFSGG